MSYEAHALDAVGDPTRRAILERLRQGPMPVGQLASGLPLSRPGVSQHLRVLERARLVRCERRGTRRIYSVDREGLEALRRWVEGFGDDVLDAFVEQTERET